MYHYNNIAAVWVKFLSSDCVCLAGGCGWALAAIGPATVGLQESHQRQGKATSGHAKHMPGIVSVAMGQFSKICSDSFKRRARPMTGKVFIGFGFL